MAVTRSLARAGVLAAILTPDMEFQWDPGKDKSNQRKHSIGFREAATVFEDVLSTTFPDPDHSDDEDRFLTVGMSVTGRILSNRAFRRGRNHTDDQRQTSHARRTGIL